MCTCVCLCVGIWICDWNYLQSIEKGARYHGARVTGGCDSSDMDTGSHTCILWNTKKSS